MFYVSSTVDSISNGNFRRGIVPCRFGVKLCFWHAGHAGNGVMEGAACNQSETLIN